MCDTFYYLLIVFWALILALWTWNVFKIRGIRKKWEEMFEDIKAEHARLFNGKGGERR